MEIRFSELIFEMIVHGSMRVDDNFTFIVVHERVDGDFIKLFDSLLFQY